MLNCCIEKKQQREIHEKLPADEESEKEDSTDEQEFFECMEENDDGKSEQPVIKAIGRLKKLGDNRLLNDKDDLYIPETQEPVAMTEDMLAEQADILTR